MSLLWDHGHDLHVHSTWSDDAVSTLEENVDAARRRGLRTLCLVEHVRRSSEWVPEFVAAAQPLTKLADLDVHLGVEAKLLSTDGTLDLPAGLTGLDHVLVADHQWPTDDGPRPPSAIRAAYEAGTVGKGELIAGLVDATVAALDTVEHALVAHLFSILPKVGFGEDDVPDEAVAHLAKAAARAGAWVEVNEKWSCPSPRVIEALVRSDVSLVLSTDAHDCRDVGAYQWVTSTLETVGLAPPGRQPSGR